MKGNSYIFRTKIFKYFRQTKNKKQCNVGLFSTNLVKKMIEYNSQWFLNDTYKNYVKVNIILFFKLLKFFY